MAVCVSVCTSDIKAVHFVALECPRRQIGSCEPLYTECIGRSSEREGDSLSLVIGERPGDRRVPMETSPTPSDVSIYILFIYVRVQYSV